MNNTAPDCGVQGAQDEGDWCPPHWDDISCWPRTKSGSLAVKSCMSEFEGVSYDTTRNASKWCWSNGTWANYSDYSECKQLPTGVQYDLKSLEEGYKRSEIAAQLYLIGYGLSFAALIIAVVIYLYCRELRCLRNSIHTNLMFTYILADLLWMCLHVSQISLISNIQFCAVFFILYHYFQLTNYYWMFVEGLYLYLLVVRTFSGDTIKLRTCMLLGWGLPLCVVVTWVIARLVKTYEASGMEEEMLSKHCPWMIRHPYDLLYEISAIFVLCVNVLFLFRIMWVLITKLRSANNQEAQQYRKAAKALLVLIPLLGVTYILMMYGPTDGPIADWFNYVRAVMFSFQGLMVAVLYCFLNGEVRNALRHHYERWRTERSLGDRNRNSYAQYAQRDNTESVRLYTRPDANNTVNNYAKETTISEPSPAVTTALPIPNNNNNNHNNNHHHNNYNNNNNNNNKNGILQKFFAARSKTSHI